MECRLFLYVVIRQRAPVLQLLTSEDETLLVRWDSFFVLNFRFYVVNSITSFNIKSNCFPGEGLDEDLHAAAKAEYQMDCRLFLDVIVRQCTPILQLLTSEDE